ncbi:unnamed protein product [Arabidopsis lyrata]|nr:unnamed protein product [Arabidopsis lyrata]
MQNQWLRESEPSESTLLRKSTQVDFFGEEFIVTVTPDPSVIGQWIHDVLFHSRLSSHPLVVGVGVQWTPSGYHPASPPVSLIRLR